MCVVEYNRDEKVSMWLHSSRFGKSNGWTVGNEADNRDSARPRRFEGQTEKGVGGAAEGMTKGGENYWISPTVIAEREEYNVNMYWQREMGVGGGGGEGYDPKYEIMQNNRRTNSTEKIYR